MTFSPDTTVGELAAGFPGAVKVFQRRNLEFCCGGSLTLRQVCEDTGTPYDSLRAELDLAISQAPRRLTWSDRPLSELAAHIVEAFHDPLRQELPRLRQMTVKLQAHRSHGQALTAVQRELDRIESLLLKQMAVEEESVFPLIAALDAASGGDQQRSFAACQRDADRFRRNARRTLRRLRTVTGGYVPPPNACPTWRALYRALQEFEQLMQLHVHLETNVLFARAASMLGGPCVEKAR